MMNDEMAAKIVEVELANAGIEENTHVTGKMLKKVLVELIKMLEGMGDTGK